MKKYGIAITAQRELERQRQHANAAMKIIAAKVLRTYRETQEPIGDSDLYDEQPRTLSVPFTLGELRNLEIWSDVLGLPRQGEDKP